MTRKKLASASAAAQNSNRNHPSKRLTKGAGFEPGTSRETWEEEKIGYAQGVRAETDALQKVLAGQQGSHAQILREMMRDNAYGTQAQFSDVFDVLSYEDRMIHQQWYPGTAATPYVAAGTPMPSPSTCFKNNNSETNTEMIGDNLNSVPLGTGDYVVVAFCPSFTLLNGSGGSNRYEETEKLSGVIFNQSDLTSEPGIELSWFDDVRYSRNMLEIYGSDCTGFSTAGFIWAAEMEIKTLAPLANLVGSYYKGTVTVGQLGATGRLSIQDLIEIATETGVHSSSSSLRSSVVNRNIVFSGSTDTESTHNITNMSQQFQQEAISYIIMQKPVQNITTGDNSAFSLMMSVKGNCVFWPDARDSIANGLGHALLQSASPHSNKHERNPQRLLPPIDAGTFMRQPPKSNGGFLSQLSKLVEFAWDQRDTIAGGIASAASFLGPLMLAASPQSETETLFVKFSYNRALQHLDLATKYFEHDESMAEVIQALRAQMQYNRTVLEGADWRGQRIVPESAFNAQIIDGVDVVGGSVPNTTGNPPVTTPSSSRRF